MMCISLAGATTIFTATIGFGDLDSGDHGRMWNIELCPQGSENTRLCDCTSTASGNTGFTESRDKISLGSTFMQSLPMTTETTTIKATVVVEATEKAKNTRKNC